MTYTEKSFLSLNSQGFHNIVYSDWGPKDGNIVICVHGLTGNGHDFDYLAPALVEDGHQVIAIDLPGRGRSEFLQNPFDYTYNQYLTDITALLARLGVYPAACVPHESSSFVDFWTQYLPYREHYSCPRVDWIGVSLGGLLGIRMAGLPLSPIKRMIINDVGPIVPQEALDFIYQVIAQEYVFETIYDLEQRMRETRGLTWGPITDEQWKHMAEHNARPLPDGRITYGYDPKISEVFKFAPIGDVDLWPLWDKIDEPVQLIRGENSTLLTLDIVAEMCRRKTGGLLDFVEIENAGHVPSLMAPDQIELVRSWLKNTQT